MNKLKISLVIGAIILGLSTIVYFQNNTINSITKEYENASLNLKAYVSENESLRDDSIKSSRVYYLSNSLLSQYSDSLLVKLNKYKNDLKIKDKDLLALLLVKSKTRVDTFIQLKDTVLVVGTNIDTTILDKWFSLNLKLRYPDTIRVSPSFKNELFAAIHTTRETIEPPKKFFIARWFQKKLTIIVADIEDKNPYTEFTQLRFIQITK